jgi:hypothetical protein
MYSGRPAFSILAQVQTFFIAKSDFTNSYLLRCRVDYPLKRGATKGESMIRYICPLMPNRENSIKAAFPHAESYAKLYVNQVVIINDHVFFAEETILNFGKYAGKSLGDIKILNPGYVSWLAKNLTPKNIDEQRISKQAICWGLHTLLTNKAV